MISAWPGSRRTRRRLRLIAWIAGKDWLGYSFSVLSRNLYAITAVLAFLAFDKVNWPYSARLSEIGTKSLGIYLVNMPAMHIVALFFYWVVPWLLGIQLLLQIILFVAGLGGYLLLMDVYQPDETAGRLSLPVRVRL